MERWGYPEIGVLGVRTPSGRGPARIGTCSAHGSQMTEDATFDPLQLIRDRFGDLGIPGSRESPDLGIPGSYLVCSCFTPFVSGSLPNVENIFDLYITPIPGFDPWSDPLTGGGPLLGHFDTLEKGHFGVTRFAPKGKKPSFKGFGEKGELRKDPFWAPF